MESSTQEHASEISKPVEITQYNDYVLYLKDLIEFKKQTTSFSYRVFCQKSGFKSPSYLKWVVQGVRPISLKSVYKFVNGLSLSKREATYFVLMVNFKEAADPQTKRFYYEQMLDAQKKQISVQTKDAYTYLSHWYYIAIREMIGSADFQNDPRWVSDRLGGSLTIWEIKNGLETLERLNLVKKDAQGRWQQTTKNLHTEPEVRSLAAYNYHAEMLAVAEQVLSKRSAEERDFQSLVAMMDKKTFEELKTKIQKFENDIVNFLQEQEQQNKQSASQELYALNMQLVPLTVRRKGE